MVRHGPCVGRVEERTRGRDAAVDRYGTSERRTTPVALMCVLLLLFLLYVPTRGSREKHLTHNIIVAR